MTFASSAGQAAQGAGTEVVLDGVARLAGADGVARNSAARLSALDGAVLGARGGGQGARWRRPG